jgi:hypothetical protein
MRAHDLACAGLSIRDAVDELGVSKSALERALQGYGSERGPKRKLTNAEVIQVRQCRAAGEDVKAIAAALKVNVATVDRALTLAKPHAPTSSAPKNAVRGSRKVTAD